ncbi:nitroreductase family protein [Carboxylicivirga sp. A043]|uniref:nitroreductase family protein n=1 Tax=Carboxylicivirga litoralis TaxID=2816963 RepID=UPI0021CB31CF|nr:nitroreductase family protein [Carboxylicivirga sp. A043]MCU4156956.1 nitroreductase family protein [Carboxylicivirga sp. A043]
MVKISADNCIKCKKCEAICPVTGVDIENNNISKDCIQCYHCGAICPQKAIGKGKLVGKTSQNNIQPYDFELLMEQRRSHRIFSTQQVSPELLKKFVEHMRYSPTASNLQNLSFTIVTNKKKLKEINDLSIETISKAFRSINDITKPIIRLLKGRHTLKTMEQSKRKFLQKAELRKDMICYNAPALIVVHSESMPTGMPCHDANIWTGMATLYAELLNLSTCINGYIVNAAKRNKKIKQVLHIPIKNEIHSTILIGYPRTKFENRIERKMPKINFISE